MRPQEALLENPESGLVSSVFGGVWLGGPGARRLAMEEWAETQQAAPRHRAAAYEFWSKLLT